MFNILTSKHNTDKTHVSSTDSINEILNNLEQNTLNLDIDNINSIPSESMIIEHTTAIKENTTDSISEIYITQRPLSFVENPQIFSEIMETLANANITDFTQISNMSAEQLAENNNSLSILMSLLDSLNNKYSLGQSPTLNSVNTSGLTAQNFTENTNPFSLLNFIEMLANMTQMEETITRLNDGTTVNNLESRFGLHATTIQPYTNTEPNMQTTKVINEVNCVSPSVILNPNEKTGTNLTCTNDVDCPSSEGCQNGRCVNLCVAEEHNCPPYSYCSVTNHVKHCICLPGIISKDCQRGTSSFIFSFSIF